MESSYNYVRVVIWDLLRCTRTKTTLLHDWDGRDMSCARKREFRDERWTTAAIWLTLNRVQSVKPTKHLPSSPQMGKIRDHAGSNRREDSYNSPNKCCNFF